MVMKSQHEKKLHRHIELLLKICQNNTVQSYFRYRNF